MKILLTTDGSDSAQAALDFILSLPLPSPSEVILLTVIEKAVYKSGRKADLSAEQIELLQQTKRMLHEEADELLRAGAARLEAAGYRCSTQIRAGHPSREIVRAAKKLAVDLVVVGSHGLGGIKRFLLGSTSDQVLAYAPCSVLIVKPPAPPDRTQATEADAQRPWRMLVAYDDSPPARQAVELCASLPLSEPAQISVLTVLPVMTLYRQDIKQQLSWVWKERKKQAQKSLQRLTEEYTWPITQVTTQLREASDVSQEILDYAQQLPADLLILGHKGKGAIEKFLLGSVTLRIAHHAACSVLAVRGKKHKKR